MYSITVSHHILIAHSLAGAVFGPAQQLHGATLVVEAELRAAALDADGVVCDIGRLLATLQGILMAFDYHNLDELIELRGHNTTTEFLAGEIHRRLGRAIRDGALGEAAAGGIAGLKIVLRESPVVWGAFDGPIA